MPQKRTFGLILLIGSLLPVHGYADVPSPTALGWGNLLVPGLAATLRGYPGRGIVEAISEVGLFYGGAYSLREGTFTIDSTIIFPKKGPYANTLIGQSMQQVGLKAHMYQTFYHYQQATLQAELEGTAPRRKQKIYKGSWADTLTAPFRWKHLKSPWVFIPIAAAAAILFADYRSRDIKTETYRASTGEHLLYAGTGMLLVPMGSAFGEEPLFRGFMQREFSGYTRSIPVGILLQTAVFTLLHPSSNRAQAIGGGLYFGYLTERSDGDIEPAVAVHFWINFISGLLDYFAFRKSQGGYAPFSHGPGLQMSFNF